MDESAMTDSEWANHFLSIAEFFALAEARLSLKTPEALTDPHIIPRDNDEDADPAVLAAIAAMRPIRTAAVLVVTAGILRNLWTRIYKI